MQKKKFDFSFSAFSGISIPVAIVVGAILIIWGINSLLTTEKSYKDLVLELQNKTFGNRWVAAFELSKYLNSSAIPEEDKPWLIENLTHIYGESIDGKTRNFIIIALASLKDPRVLPILETALSDHEPDVRFHALIGLGNFPQDKIPSTFPWNKVENFLNDPDPAVKQVALFTLATHQIKNAIGKMKTLLQDKEREVRYAAATALATFKEAAAIENLQELLRMTKNKGLTPAEYQKIEKYQVNALSAIQKSHWNVFKEEISQLAQNSSSLAVQLKSKEVLHQWKENTEN